MNKSAQTDAAWLVPAQTIEQQIAIALVEQVTFMVCSGLHDLNHIEAVKRTRRPLVKQRKRIKREINFASFQVEHVSRKDGATDRDEQQLARDFDVPQQYITISIAPDGSEIWRTGQPLSEKTLEKALNDLAASI